MIDAIMHGQNNKVIIPSHAFVISELLGKMIPVNVAVFSFRPN